MGSFLSVFWNLLSQISLDIKDPILCFSLQLDQLAVDAAKEKRDMEQKHSTIQQKVLGRM